jgi:hypothetical protein
MGDLIGNFALLSGKGFQKMEERKPIKICLTGDRYHYNRSIEDFVRDELAKPGRADLVQHEKKIIEGVTVGIQKLIDEVALDGHSIITSPMRERYGHLADPIYDITYDFCCLKSRYITITNCDKSFIMAITSKEFERRMKILNEGA